ncbi:MAG: SBBP repeat-containing protein [Candidatus Aminicenantes bacterium]|jgi:hypothetical protein
MKTISFISHFLLIGLLVFFTTGKDKKTTSIKNLDLDIKREQNRVPTNGQAAPGIGKNHLYFIPNQGQVNKKAIFYAKTKKYILWLTKKGLVFDRIRNTPSALRGHPSPEGNNRGFPHSTHSTNIQRQVSRLIFLNANKDPEIVPMEETKHRVNYFKGNHQSQWHLDIPTSKAIVYKNIYKNIHLKVYGIEKQVEYDWIVKPGGNPGDIKFEYKNIKGTRIDDEGNLLMETGFGRLMHKKPLGYQSLRGNYKLQNTNYKPCTIDVKFKKIGKNIYGFKVNQYDKNAELIIDPVVLVYSTYLGGDRWEESYAIAVDNNGYAYVTGGTWSTDFPLRDQYRADPGSEDYDAFITKIDTRGKGGSSLIYSTYLGGKDSDSGSSIAVDNNGNVYVTGHTWSEDFPTNRSYQSYKGEGDVFVVKIDTTGSGASSLIYSTYLGGQEADSGLGIALDSKGKAYVTGWTFSLDFPTRNPYRAEPGEDFTNAFVTQIDTSKSGTSSLLYSTYLGGKSSDAGNGIAVDGSGFVYVTGWTYSPDFPTRNPFRTNKGDVDAFVTKISPSQSGASSLVYSTYLGGGNADYGERIALDDNNNGYVYVTGTTRSTDFPTRNSFQKDQGGSDAFVTQLDTAKSGSSSLLYSTYLGGESSDKGYGIAVDTGSGYICLTGITESPNFPTHRSYQNHQGEADAFVTQLDPTRSGSSSLIFSTYLGGKNSDGGCDIAVEDSSNVYITGWTLSTDFPVMNQYRSDPGDLDYDGFVTKLFIEPEAPPAVRLSRSVLDFSAVIGGAHTGPQTLSIGNSGGGSLDWTASTSAAWLAIDPVTGSDDTIITVTVVPANLSPGNSTGTISISDPGAANSPQTVNVTLTVYPPGTTSPPFGDYSTPLDGSTVSSSIPVTGWVLDDIGVESVKIYRGEGKSLFYIGDAVFVEGARPDIEAAYPGYPLNYQAGWGYMMLTNFLPNGGNGTFHIHAVAMDTEGQQISLGTKTIIVDNANAVKPFGAIDTPTQGGITAGSGFINWGWVLTPQPNSIPTDGSTINVWVDGVNLGHPTYNIYRSDIAQLFPGYNNSSGAAGYFKLDTTVYSNGVHTIQWTATDDAGNRDGIGSRYFTIQNTGNNSSVKSRGQGGLPPCCQDSQDKQDKGQALLFRRPGSFAHLSSSPDEPIFLKKGYNKNTKPQRIYPDENGLIIIDIQELQRIEIHLQEAQELFPSAYIGRQVVGHQLRPLPIGSFLDREKGIFYWQPGPGFVGNYRLVFMQKNQIGQWNKINIQLKILPKH